MRVAVFGGVRGDDGGLACAFFQVTHAYDVLDFTEIYRL